MTKVLLTWLTLEIIVDAGLSVARVLAIRSQAPILLCFYTDVYIHFHKKSKSYQLSDNKTLELCYNVFFNINIMVVVFKAY